MINGCGRYEFKQGTSNKFWEIQPHDSGGYIAQWGRNGHSPQDHKIYNANEAEKKIREKLGKGYRIVSYHADGSITQSKSLAKICRPEIKDQVVNGEKAVENLEKIADQLLLNGRPNLRLVRDSEEDQETTTSKSLLEVIYPARCEASLPEDLEQPHLIGEQKLDGSRYVLYFGYDPYGRQKNYSNTLLSRHPSRIIGEDQGKLVDRTFELKHVTGQDYKELKGTVIDGECMNGFETYNAFDIMFFRGEDVRLLPLKERRVILEKVVKMMNNKFVSVIPQITKNLKEYFLSIVEAGGEGIVVKDLNSKYGESWAKYKKSYDISVVITGKKAGKEADTVGSVAVSVYQSGKLIEIGYAAGFDKKTKIAMAKNFKPFMGKVLDIFAQEMTKSTTGLGRLRHCPREVVSNRV